MRHLQRLYLISTIIYLFLAYSVFFLFEDEVIVFLTKEDGFFESLGAIFFLLSSFFFFILFWKDKSGNNFRFISTKRNIFYLFFGIIFFLGFGEEISWGQRIFNFETPNIIKERNFQGEFNIHNLDILMGKDLPDTQKGALNKIGIGRIFQAFWFCYCILIPLFSRYIGVIFRQLKRINLPIIPIWLGIMFMANYLLSRILVILISDNLFNWIIEIKECNVAFLFLVASLYFFSGRNKKEDSPG